MITTFDEAMTSVAAVAAQPEADAGQALRQAFALVPHRNDFLPGYAVRNVLLHPAVPELDRAGRLRLADRATAAMVEWLAEAVQDADHPKRKLLTEKVPRAFYQSLRQVLEGLREVSPDEELVWRLVQLGGYGPADAARLLGVNEEQVEGWWQSAEVQVEVGLEHGEPSWDAGLLELADVRPPGEVTQILIDVRAGRRKLWDVVESPAGWDRLRRTARKVLGGQEGQDSVLHESLLRLAMKDRPVPENAQRLEAYVAQIMRNLVRDRYRQQDEMQQVEDDGHLDRLLAGWLGQEGKEDSQERRDEMLAAFREALEAMQRDKPNLFEVLELWIGEGAELSEPKQAERLGMSVATLGRRKQEVRQYLLRWLSEGDFATGRLENKPRRQRMEDLYQLIEKQLTGPAGLPRGGNYRLTMAEALTGMALSGDPDYDVLYASYLGPSRKPKEVAETFGLSTKELNEWNHRAKGRLVERMVRLVHDQRFEGAE